MWVGRWLSALRQWDEVEAGFASNYGLSLDEVMALTWRRFIILFGGVFKWNDPLPEPAGRIADTVDWSSVTHRPVKDVMSTGLAGMGVKVNQVPTGASE